MGHITWNTEVNAPCCPGEILSDDGRSILIQTDWDYPGVAASFGWDITAVQACNRRGCGHVTTEAPDNRDTPDGEVYICPECEREADCCEHCGTDGTVDCECGVTATDFISAARDWLESNDGITVMDPGYFD